MQSLADGISSNLILYPIPQPIDGCYEIHARIGVLHATENQKIGPEVVTTKNYPESWRDPAAVGHVLYVEQTSIHAARLVRVIPPVDPDP